MLRLLDAEQAAGRLHHQEVAVEAGGVEMIAHLAEIAPHPRTDIGIGRGGGGALELAIFLRELVRGGDEEVRMALLDDLFHPLLMRGVAVGVQEQDGDRLHPLLDSIGDGGAHLLLVERDQHLALRVDTLADLVAQVALDQRLMPAEEQIVGFRPIDAPDLVDVAKALRGDERAARAAALEDGVDRDRRAVEEELGRAELRSGLGHAILDAGDQPRRRRQRLPQRQLPGGLVESGNVGESAADIGGESNPI